MRTACTPGQGRRAGMTVVELLTVLAVVAVLLTMSAPDLARMVRQYRVKAATGDLYAALEQARAQAIARGSRILLVPSAADGVSWRDGWVVLADHDGDRRPGAGDDILAEYPALDPRLSVSSVFTSQKGPSYVAFNGAGRTCSDNSSAAARWGSFTITDGDSARRIRISMLGRSRVCDPERDGASCGPAE